MAESTFAKPVITAPALLASDRPWRRSSRSERLDVVREGVGTLASALKAREKRRRLTASSTRSRRAVTQTPRPGSLWLQVRHDLVVGPEDEADQSRGGHEPRG